MAELTPDLCGKPVTEDLGTEVCYDGRKDLLVSCRVPMCQLWKE